MTRAFLGAVVGLACLLVAGSAAGRPAATPKPVAPALSVRLVTKSPDVLVLTAPGYRLTLSKENGEILDLLDRRTGTRLVRGQNGCLWAAKQTTGVSAGGCGFGRGGNDRFTYRWSAPTATLTLRYESSPGGPGVDATVVLVARSSSFDLRLSLESSVEYPLSAVLFPADLYLNALRVTSGYTPTFLPGLRLEGGFFDGPHRNVETYPSRWAFADFLAADLGRSHIALYSVNPSPAPVAPVDLGFVRGGEASPCGDAAFCATHVFQTWTEAGKSWRSPTVRIRVGGSIEQSIGAYRRDNGIDRYPSLAEKLGGPRLSTLTRAPLVKADLWKGLPRFADWAPNLRRLPQPALIHPVAFQEGGFDERYPDFLPPDSQWGTTADLNGVIADAHALGQLVMPYLNVSWWDTYSPSIDGLPATLAPKDIAVQSRSGTPATETFGDKVGWIVSPHVPAVRARIDRVLEEWRSDVAADCVFFDQIGARPWRRDFNPASPTPLAYYDGWLTLFAPYRDRCVMVEDGWDRLAESFTGFHGGVLQMSRQFEWPNLRFGQGNWEPFPLAGYLFGDKALLYQHDLYEETMTTDPEVLTFNLAFGLVLSYTWDGQTGSLDSPWVDLVGKVQRTLGPQYAGRRVAAFKDVSPGVTQTTYEGGLTVVANWSPSKAADVDGQTVAPLGFVARAPDGAVLAATYGERWSGVTFPAGAR